MGELASLVAGGRADAACDEPAAAGVCDNAADAQQGAATSAAAKRYVVRKGLK